MSISIPLSRQYRSQIQKSYLPHPCAAGLGGDSDRWLGLVTEPTAARAPGAALPAGGPPRASGPARAPSPGGCGGRETGRPTPGPEASPARAARSALLSDSSESPIPCRCAPWRSTRGGRAAPSTRTRQRRARAAKRLQLVCGRRAAGPSRDLKTRMTARPGSRLGPLGPLPSGESDSGRPQAGAPGVAREAGGCRLDARPSHALSRPTLLCQDPPASAAGPLRSDAPSTQSPGPVAPISDDRSAIPRYHFAASVASGRTFAPQDPSRTRPARPLWGRAWAYAPPMGSPALGRPARTGPERTG